MKKRIDKKKHTKYLFDVGIEITQDEEWRFRLSQLNMNEVITITNDQLSLLFKKLNFQAPARMLKYEIKRIELISVPNSLSSWWDVNDRTIFLAFYPAKYKKSIWYVAIQYSVSNM